MQYRYAQIDGGGVAFAVSELAEKVERADMVWLDPWAVDVIGKRWTGEGWEAMPEMVERPALTRLQFRERFTPAEKLAIYQAAEADLRVRIWLDDLNAASEVRTDYPATVEGVQALEAAGVIGPGRAAVILA